MSERQFSGYQQELKLEGRIDNSESRESFHHNLMTMYELVVDYDDDYLEDDDADPNDMFKNYTALTHEVLEHIRTGIKIDGESASGEIDVMFDMLESGDMNDSFGSEGWRHYLGWDE